MCQKPCGHRKKLPTLMTIQRVNGARGRLRSSLRDSNSATATEDLRQLLRRDNFELGIGAVARLLVRAPPPKLRNVTEAASLHVVVSDFDRQLGTERLPGQVLALAPAALATRYTMLSFVCESMLGPVFPRVSGERVLAVRREEFYKLASLLFREARADADVLQRTGVVVEAQQE